MIVQLELLKLPWSAILTWMKLLLCKYLLLSIYWSKYVVFISFGGEHYFAWYWRSFDGQCFMILHNVCNTLPYTTLLSASCPKLRPYSQPASMCLCSGIDVQTNHKYYKYPLYLTAYIINFHYPLWTETFCSLQLVIGISLSFGCEDWNHNTVTYDLVLDYQTFVTACIP